MRIRKSKAADMLQRKKAELSQYIMEYDHAVLGVTDAVQSLIQINDCIGEKIREIDDYQSELTQTRENLYAAERKNSQVIQNFKALLCMED